MLDQEDEGTRIGVAVSFAVVALVVAGLLAGLVVRQLGHKGQGMARPSGLAAQATPADFIDAELKGELLGSLYFGVGQSALPEGVDQVVIKVALTALDAPKGRVLVSGFHDASGSTEVNAQIARQRALSVLNALIAEGVPAERISLRKPEVTLGDADPIEARRVEVWLVD